MTWQQPEASDLSCSWSQNHMLCEVILSLLQSGFWFLLWSVSQRNSPFWYTTPDSINKRRKLFFYGSNSSVQSLSCVQLLATPWTAAHQVSLSITNTQSLLKLISIELVSSNNFILCHPLSSHLQSFPASGSFQTTQFFPSGGRSIGISVSASVSVLPTNMQDWPPLGWTGLISLQSTGLSRVFSNTTVQKHQFFGAQLSLESNSHIHTWLLEKP